MSDINSCRINELNEGIKVTKKDKNCILYQLKNENGEMTTTEYKVLPGVSLIYREVHISKCDYSFTYPSGLIEISFCRDGRIEYEGKDLLFCISKDDMSIIQSTGEQIVLHYPTNHYKGVSVLINPTLVNDNLCNIDDIEISINMLIEKFCKDKNYFVTQCTKRLEAVFSEMYQAPCTCKMGYFKIKVLELLMLLTDIQLENSPKQELCCSKEQFCFLKQVCDYVRANLHIRITIDELAKQFHMSPSQLKKCVSCVHGKPVYSFIRTYKMQLAAKDLRDTEQSIIEIAALYGYENSSKFANAFKTVMGVSPSQYRKEIRMKNVVLEQ